MKTLTQHTNYPKPTFSNEWCGIRMGGNELKEASGW